MPKAKTKPSKTKPSKRAQITSARKAYATLNRAYHTAGRKAMNTPKNSMIHKLYATIKRARNAAGAKLGKLTGVR